MKPNRWITDLRHLMRPDGTLVGDRSTSLPVYLSLLVEAATASPADAWTVSPVRCRLRSEHKRCPGHTHVLSGRILGYHRVGLPGLPGIRHHHRVASHPLGSASRPDERTCLISEV
jgi:hypothetical protein